MMLFSLNLARVLPFFFTSLSYVHEVPMSLSIVPRKVLRDPQSHQQLLDADKAGALTEATN